MTGPATLLLQELRREGAVLKVREGRLRIEAPKGVLSEGIKEAVRDLKDDLLVAVTAEERVTSLSLTDFERQHDAIEIGVPWLASTLWFVPTAAHANLLVGEGVARGRIWTARELLDVAELDRAVVESIGRLRVAFGAQVVSIKKGPDAPVAEVAGDSPQVCPACHRSRWWRSTHGSVVCGTCHPPAKPDLVSEWLDAP